MASLDAADIFAVKGLVAVITGGSSGIGVMMVASMQVSA